MNRHCFSEFSASISDGEQQKHGYNGTEQPNEKGYGGACPKFFSSRVNAVKENGES